MPMPEHPAAHETSAEKNIIKMPEYPKPIVS